MKNYDLMKKNEWDNLSDEERYSAIKIKEKELVSEFGYSRELIMNLINFALHEKIY